MIPSIALGLRELGIAIACIDVFSGIIGGLPVRHSNGQT